MVVAVVSEVRMGRRREIGRKGRVRTQGPPSVNPALITILECK